MEPLGATSFLLAVCVVCLMFSWARARAKLGPGKLPPGPVGLPFIGNMLQLNSKKMFTSLIQLSEKYGPVYTIHLGPEPVVILCSYDVVKEALNDQGEEFGARGSMPLLEKINRGHGVISANGERWKQLRRFSLMTLRNFGMGKRSIEERIQEEAAFLVEDLRKTQGLPFDPTFFLSRAVSNVICSVVFGRRFDYEDKKFLYLLNLLHDTFRLFSSAWGQLYNVFPNILGRLPGPHQQLFKNVRQVQEFVEERVKIHQEILDPNCPGSFIDCFLTKMNQEKGNPTSEFHTEGLVVTTFDLFSAGTETVSTTLRFGLMILLKHRDVEDKIHEEIDRVIGRNRCPAINDRNNMPYTDAVIHEIQRYSDIVPMGVPHAATKDIHFRSYVIPKGTTVFPMLSAVLHDPKQFKSASTFNPGHFLDDKGNFKRNDAFMPFSTGRRICLGEGLAKMELFLYLTTILQNFNLKCASDPKDIDPTPLMSGFGNYPRPYQLSLLPR
ncbi:cytochrome P450 2G1-like isoform X1 [Pleurodeles waltl]|uniref:cytochrome P450 2G1-like isoform X1 n=1 Tax=Pleurodeles waltl TaxID=8319 RepID=UPI00370963E4